MGTNERSALRWLCLLPLASLVVVEIYVAGYDGWGAWAAAPMLLLPALVSLPIVLWGLVEIVGARRAGPPAEASFAASIRWTIIASIPLLWLAVRRLFV